MRQFSFPEAGTISAAQAFVQGARGSIGGAYRPFRSSLLIFLYFKAEAAVNGPAWKALIEEEFGDGIMSAIDFDTEIERLPHEKGDRVKITMTGKFLPYKYYGNEQGIQGYGIKED